MSSLWPFNAIPTHPTQQLLQKDKEKRLGAKSDYEEIRSHAFFGTIDWERLEARKIKPPFVPNVVSVNPCTKAP